MSDREPRERLSGKVFAILQVCLAAVFLICAGRLVYDLAIVPRENRQMADQLKEEFPEENTPGVPSSREELPAGEKPSVSGVNLCSLQVQYPDIKGWITIPGTKIDYPVLQSSEDQPEYYLKRNYTGEWDVNGSLFLQWNCTVPGGRNLIIYGHNMNSGAMFGELDRFADEGYWREHQTVFFQTVDGITEYEIAAVLKTDLSLFRFQQVAFPDQEALKEYMRQASEQKLFKTGVSYADSPSALTLVSCSYEWNGARNIIVAVERMSE